jgi:hypothetical protein
MNVAREIHQAGEKRHQAAWQAQRATKPQTLSLDELLQMDAEQNRPLTVVPNMSAQAHMLNALRNEGHIKDLVIDVTTNPTRVEAQKSKENTEDTEEPDVLAFMATALMAKPESWHPSHPAQSRQITPEQTEPQRGWFSRARNKLAELHDRHRSNPEGRHLRRTIVAGALGVAALAASFAAGGAILGNHDSQPVPTAQPKVELEFSATHTSTTIAQTRQVTPEFHLEANQVPAFIVMVSTGDQIHQAGGTDGDVVRTLNFATAVQQAQAHPGA